MATAATTLDGFVQAILQARDTLRSERKEILTVIGVYLLQKAQLDYRTKARGGTGEDGVKWARLKRSTIANRVRRRAAAKRIVAERRTLAYQIRAIRAGLQTVPNAAQTIAAMRQRRKDLGVKLESLIDTEFSNHEIGVDTGLQRASASPGFQAPDGLGGNLLVITEVDVTIGYAREYSKYFDELRKLFPENVPELWQTEIEAIVEDWAETLLTRELSSGF